MATSTRWRRLARRWASAASVSARSRARRCTSCAGPIFGAGCWRITRRPDGRSSDEGRNLKIRGPGQLPRPSAFTPGAVSPPAPAESLVCLLLRYRSAGGFHDQVHPAESHAIPRLERAAGDPLVVDEGAVGAVGIDQNRRAAVAL